MNKDYHKAEATVGRSTILTILGHLNSVLYEVENEVLAVCSMLPYTLFMSDLYGTPYCAEPMSATGHAHITSSVQDHFVVTNGEAVGIYVDPEAGSYNSMNPSGGTPSAIKNRDTKTNTSPRYATDYNKVITRGCRKGVCCSVKNARGALRPVNCLAPSILLAPTRI